MRTTLQYMLISTLFSLRTRHDLFDDDPFKEPEPFVCMRFVLVCPTLQVLQQAHEVCPLIGFQSMGQVTHVKPYTEHLAGDDVELPKPFPLAARNRTEKAPVLYAHLVPAVIANPSGLSRCIYGGGSSRLRPTPVTASHFSGMAKPTWAITRDVSGSFPATPAHNYNRLRAGCYPTADSIFKDQANRVSAKPRNLLAFYAFMIRGLSNNLKDTF